MHTTPTAFLIVIVIALESAAAPQLPQSQVNPGDAADRAMALYYMDPWIGTWRLNVRRSVFIPGPPLKGDKAVVQPYGDGLKCTLDPVGADGETRHGEWTAQYDGGDCPAAMEPFADSVSIRKTNSSTLEVVYKKRGKTIATERWTVPRNGKHLTVIQMEEKPAGRGFRNTLVYDKE